jgi:hypothetical protein
MTRGQVSLDCVYQQAYQFIRVHRDANSVHALPRVYIKFSHLETVLCAAQEDRVLVKLLAKYKWYLPFESLAEQV